MPDEKDESSGFKVVDRRSFSVDGTPREADRPHHREEPTAHAAAPSRPAPSRPSVAESQDELEGYVEQEMSGFETLVSYLSTKAMFQLGLIPGPGGERIPADLMNARRTIDLLAVLEEKTRGNLTANEQRLLEDVVYELRLSYVEVEKRGAPKRR